MWHVSCFDCIEESFFDGEACRCVVIQDCLAGAWEFEDGICFLWCSSNIAGMFSLNIAVMVAVIFLASVRIQWHEPEAC